MLVCATVKPNGIISYDKNATVDPANPGTCLDKKGRLAKSVPFAPKAAVLGTNGAGWRHGDNSGLIPSRPTRHSAPPRPGSCGTGPWTGTPSTCTW